MDTPGRFSTLFFNGRQLLRFPVCFPLYQTPHEKGVYSERKKSAPQEENFLLEYTQIDKADKNFSDMVTSLAIVSISLKMKLKTKEVKGMWIYQWSFLVLNCIFAEIYTKCVKYKYKSVACHILFDTPKIESLYSNAINRVVELPCPPFLINLFCLSEDKNQSACAGTLFITLYKRASWSHVFLIFTSHSKCVVGTY